MNLSSSLSFVVLSAVIVLGTLLTIGIILSRLYRRASKEISFVRTGMWGQKVVMNGGALVFPVFHEVIPVNMNTLRLEVGRCNEEALITRDRMRVDVRVEFYVRVKPTIESIADAAQTLGRKTMNPGELKAHIEGKFVDALRAVAAEMTMEELHEKRTDFVQKVQQAVTEDLLKNGLELETASLTSLDQTGKQFFNPDNAFDAQGLTKLTEEIEARRKQRNDIEQDTAVAIQNKNLEAEKQRLELSKLEEYAKLEQTREIAVRRAAQMADITRGQAEKQKEAQQAEISAKQDVDLSQLEAQRVVEEQRIEMERLVKEREIIKERALEMAEVERIKTIELAKQDQNIAVEEKSRALSEARTQADTARAEAVKAEERVNTARENERAERLKLIELVEARKEAERRAIGLLVAAEAERKAAEDRAGALIRLATADADKIRLAAQADADAEKLAADAQERRYAVEAKGKHALNEALNTLSSEQVAMQVKLELLGHLAEIVKESVKPLEKIDQIKIFELSGLGGANGSAEKGNTNPESKSQGTLSDQVVNSALRYRAQAPLVDALLAEVGLSGKDLTAVAKTVQDMTQK